MIRYILLYVFLAALSFDKHNHVHVHGEHHMHARERKASITR